MPLMRNSWQYLIFQGKYRIQRQSCKLFYVWLLPHQELLILNDISESHCLALIQGNVLVFILLIKHVMNEYFPNSQDSENHTWREFPSKMWACCCAFLPFSFFTMRQRLTLEPRLARYLLCGRAHLEFMEVLSSQPRKSWESRWEPLCPDGPAAFNSAGYKESTLRQDQIPHWGFRNCDLLSLIWHQRIVPKNYLIVSLRPKGRDLVVTSCLGLRTQRSFVYIL